MEPQRRYNVGILNLFLFFIQLNFFKYHLFLIIVPAVKDHNRRTTTVKEAKKIANNCANVLSLEFELPS